LTAYDVLEPALNSLASRRCWITEQHAAHHAARARGARAALNLKFLNFHDRTLPPLVLGGIIENQNSDFVTT
jgi:hypothetical protein